MASNDSEFDDSTQYNTTAPPIHLPTPQIYPRTHLFGIPQELQDMVINEIWNDDAKNAGACSLQPLLTCRHFYHIANKQAWANTSFDLRSLSKEKLKLLLISIPSGVASRMIFSIIATAPQTITIGYNAEKLPNINRIMMTDFESDDMHVAEKSAVWFKAMMASLQLREKVRCFMATAAAFEGQMSKAVRAHTVLLVAHALLKGAETVGTFCKQKTMQAPEHYLVQYEVRGGSMCEMVLRSDDPSLC